MGGTQHLSNVSSWNHNIPRTQGIEQGPFPDMYRGPFAGMNNAGELLAHDLKETIDFCTAGNVALFMAEPI